MKSTIAIPAALFGAGTFLLWSGNVLSGETVSHTGMCDASAAILLEDDRLIIANDEDNVLRIYRGDRTGPPVRTFDLTAFLADGREGGEADIEAAARVGNRIYWITSHGANKKGKVRPERRRFFITDIVTSDNGPHLQTVGRPYAGLLEDMARDAQFDRFDLAAAAIHAPKDDGALNIEGLAAAPEGHLLIGFRNPIPGGRALLVPLLNPDELAEGRRARFGDPMQLNLGGLGIRSLEYWHEQLLIVAGPSDAGGESFLYAWNGSNRPPRRLETPTLNELNPEAMAVDAEDSNVSLWIVSDDGGREFEACECKDLDDPSRQQFRTVLWPLNATAQTEIVGPFSRLARHQ